MSHHTCACTQMEAQSHLQELCDAWRDTSSVFARAATAALPHFTFGNTILKKSYQVSNVSSNAQLVMRRNEASDLLDKRNCEGVEKKRHKTVEKEWAASCPQPHC